MSKRKFKKGREISSIGELEYRLSRGEWVYLRDVPKHPSVLLSMTLRTLKIFISGGSLYEAVRNEEDEKYIRVEMNTASCWT